MAEAWAARPVETKQVSEMSEAERATAFAVLVEPPPYVNPLPPDLAEKRVEDMSPTERRRSATALGIPMSNFE